MKANTPAERLVNGIIKSDFRAGAGYVSYTGCYNICY